MENEYIKNNEILPKIFLQKQIYGNWKRNIGICINL